MESFIELRYSGEGVDIKELQGKVLFASLEIKKILILLNYIS